MATEGDAEALLAKCTGPDRSRFCYKFGSEDHRMGRCSTSPKRFVCIASSTTFEESELYRLL